MVTRSAAAAHFAPSTRCTQRAHPRLARGAQPSIWLRLPAELHGRIAGACNNCSSLRALDAVDRSLWATRVERLLSALQGTPSEPLLLHVRHLADRAAPELVASGIVPALIQCIADGDALPTGGLALAFGTVTALLDAAKAADPKTSMLEATVAAELLQKNLLGARAILPQPRP